MILRSHLAFLLGLCALNLPSVTSPPTTSPTVTTTTAITEDCPDADFVTFGERCYYIALETDHWLKLPNADNICKSRRSDLVGIESEEEYDFLTKEISRQIRIRPEDPFQFSQGWRKQFWTSGQRLGMGWVWNQSRVSELPTPHVPLTIYKPMNFTAWRKGEPSNVYEQGLTVLYRQGEWGWNDFKAIDDLSFVCEREIYGSEGCQRGFIEYNRSCYLFKSIDMSQTRATIYCNGLGAHLLAIETQEEWHYIQAEIEKVVVARGETLTYEQWWTGGKQTWFKAREGPFDPIGDQMLFEWDITLSQIPSENWYPYHPLRDPKHTYLTIYYKNSRWFWLDEPRESNLHYICEMKTGGKVCGGPGAGWIERGDSCYLIPRYTTKDRNAAEVACMERTGRLVSFDSRDELEFIISRISSGSLADGAKWWTGGLPVKGTWVWSHDYARFLDTSHFVNWSPGEPNNWDDEENHVTLSFRDGRWGLNDVPNEFHVTLPFICEAKRVSQQATCPEKVGRPQITRLPRTGGTWASLMLNNTFPCPGQVTLWQYYRSNPEFTVYAGIWRPFEDFEYTLVGVTEFPPGPMGKTTVEAPRAITVVPGDIMGIHYSRSAEAGVIAHAVSEDRAVSNEELSAILVLELHNEDIAIGELVDVRQHTTNSYEQCISIFARVSEVS